MNLSPEVAAVLRHALKEAHATREDLDAYFILVYAIENLLPPLPEEPTPSVPEGFVFVARWPRMSVSLKKMALQYGEDARCCHPGPAGGFPLIIRPIN